MTLTMAQAYQILAIATEKAEELNVKISIVILDARGDLKAAVRLDGAPWRSTFFAQGKAFASAMNDMSSADLAERADWAITRALMLRERGNFLCVQGALPIRLNGEQLGAVGVSGAPSSQVDEDIAAAALAEFDPIVSAR